MRFISPSVQAVKPIFWLIIATNAFIAEAKEVYWIDWSGCSTTRANTPVSCTGRISTKGRTIDVTYTNNQGIAFSQTGTGTDYFTYPRGKRDTKVSPYTSKEVSNIPPPAEMIGLQRAGKQTLTFSEPVKDLFFAYVSLNGNGYGFDQDFTILPGNTRCGYWGCGSVTKRVQNGEYQLIGSGEPHGTIVFRNSFSSLTWRSLANEHWNGVTIGITNSVAESTKAPTPSPTSNINPPTTGQAKGDPHFKTWSGAKYDFHGVCDLVLLKNAQVGNGISLDIHIRTAKSRMWSFIRTAVVRVGQETFEVMGGKHKNHFWKNKMRGDLSDLPTMTVSGFPVTFTQISPKSRQFQIDLGHDTTIVMKTWNAFVSVNIEGHNSEHFGSSLGLMGTFPAGLKIGRDNTTLIEDVNAFGQEWQVNTATDPDLFHDIDGPQYPNKCEIPSASQIRRRLGESVVTKEDAQIACSRVTPEDFDLCVFDVMATNDKNAVGAY